LSDEVEAVEMVETFNVGWEAATVFGVDLDSVRLDAGFRSFINRNCNTSI
jgi:hypothetical protein